MKSHGKIAKDLKISRQAVDSWFKGKTKPCKKNMKLLCKSLDMKHNDVADLLFNITSLPEKNEE